MLSEWTDVCGLSSRRTRVTYGRSVYTEPSQFLARPWASVQEIRLATTKYGCTWTLSATDMLMCHEENHEQRVLLKERSCPYPPNKEKGRYDDDSDHSLSSLSSVEGEMSLKSAQKKQKMKTVFSIHFQFLKLFFMFFDSFSFFQKTVFHFFDSICLHFAKISFQVFRSDFDLSKTVIHFFILQRGAQTVFSFS